MEQIKAINLGCGVRFHPEWTNLDLYSSDPHVQACDLQRGIPADDASFDIVYHSHVLEHLYRPEAFGLLRECHRVLRSGGIIRVAVPDLERITRTYIRALEGALSGEAEWRERYEWIILELYDQMVRERSGGGMYDYCQQNPIPAEDFVVERLGGEALRMIAYVKRRDQVGNGPFFRRTLAKVIKAAKRAIKGCASLALGRESIRAVDAARFRLSGEIHRWMYDRYSLGRALEETGFRGPIVQTAHSSLIADWDRYCLDTEPDGSIYKPDSLYMEAIKP